MKAKKKTYSASGFTLIEILISLGIFSVLMAILYPTFSSVSNRVNELSDKQALTQNGQRVMDYMSEEFRLIGLFVGARPSITFCGESNVDSIQHVDGTTNDQVTFLTSVRIPTAKDGVPYTMTTVSAGVGVNSLPVNATQSDVSAIKPSTSTTANGSAFITFDTLQPNLGILVYQVTAFGGSSLSITPNLDQNVNAQSNAYSVVRKRFAVDASRNLQLQMWDKD
jgi:prepilin-type N-terminal cleavage/methylation domain-containing protein